jgi:hypothetical protein
VEEFFLVHFGRRRVMADEHHFDLVVHALEEQVEQDEEALGGVLARFVHRAGHVHDAEHHRLRHRLGHLDAVVVAQVERVDEGDGQQARVQVVDQLFQLDHARVLQRHAFQQQLFQFALGLDHALARIAADGDAPAQRAAQERSTWMLDGVPTCCSRRAGS